MADNASDKKPMDFAAQHEDADPEKALEDAGEERPVTPQKSGSFHEDMNRFTSDEESDHEDLTMGTKRSERDDDSVKIPIDTTGMDDVELQSVEEVKTKQPKSKPKKEKKPKKPSSIDYVNRDPENLQEAVKVNFADIIAEPTGAQSFNTIWGSSYKVYSLTKYWLYRIMTLFCGVPCALFWGIYFACLAFLSIWWIMPCIRAIAIKMNFVSRVWSLCIRTFLDPIFESLGLILSRIRIMLTLRRD